SAPHDRLPRVMDGVVARSSLPAGSPRVVEVAGGTEAWDALLSEYDPALFDETVVGPPEAN
ncbi:MAG: hypothetical protein OEO23_13315, partial [Gemmatimonadota bacterium]|nr:hypothetical protein [Gemmatimonadota bacterium]